MNSTDLPVLSLHEQLTRRTPHLPVTTALIVANGLVFVAMLFSGAGFWHSSNGVPLAWGANFGPATQDGEWWRLGSAMFLHFGVIHLVLNMLALRDAGQWVERMFGHYWFAAIYLVAGLLGNLASLVFHQGHAVSGGASGAIFGVYGALLAYLWLHRTRMQRGEFRWLFWAAIGFSFLSIAFGLLVPGIDNAAHLGGLGGGLLMGAMLLPETPSPRPRWISAAMLMAAVIGLLAHLPTPAYRWSDEARVQQEIDAFLRKDMGITQEWNRLMWNSRRSGTSFDELARRLDQRIADRYEQSFEELAALPDDAALPSAHRLELLRQYAGQRRDATRELADGLRTRDGAKIREALEQVRKLPEKP